MRVPYVVAFGLISAFAPGVIATDQPPLVVAGQTVVVPSGNLRLKAFLWKPNGPGPFPAVLFCHGSGGPDATHTAGLPMTEAAEKLAPLFLKHGYAFLYLFRRGQGLSTDQGPFMQDIFAARRSNERERRSPAFAVPSGHHGSPRRCHGCPGIPESRTRNRRQAYCDCRPLVWRSTNTARHRARQRGSCCSDVRGDGRVVGSVRLNCASGSELRRIRRWLRRC